MDEAIQQSPFFKAEATDVVKALKLLLNIAECPPMGSYVDTVFRTQANQLRHEADLIEQREKDIAWARTILAKWEGRAK